MSNIKTLLASLALCAIGGAAHASEDGVCPKAWFIAQMGNGSAQETMRQIDATCMPGDKITLPKYASYLVSAACDLNKPTVDLGGNVLCILRDSNPAPTKRAKR